MSATTRRAKAAELHAENERLRSERNAMIGTNAELIKEIDILRGWLNSEAEAANTMMVQRDEAHKELERVIRETDPEIMLGEIWKLIGRPAMTEKVIGGKTYRVYEGALSTLEMKLAELDAMALLANQLQRENDALAARLAKWTEVSV